MDESMKNHDGKVELVGPEKMNLLGILMKTLLEANMAVRWKAWFARKITGDVRVQAGKMAVTLAFAGGNITIYGEERPNPRATVKGKMKGLLDIVTGCPFTVSWAVLSGAVRIGGNIFLMLLMLPVIRAGKSSCGGGC